MNASYELERRLAAYYASEAPSRAPDRVLEAALASIDSTRQRRAVLRPSWRFPTMNSYAKVAIAAVAVVAIGAVGLAVLRPGPVTDPGIVMRSDAPTAGPSASPLDDLSQHFDSGMHGISLSYPAGWTFERATVSWQSGLPGDTEGARDILSNGASESSFIGLASQPLAGKSGGEWANELLMTPGCTVPAESISVAGQPGFLAGCSDSGTNGLLALTWDQTRGYWIVLYGLDDRALFDRILATVELRPVQAVRGSASNFVRPFDYVLPVDPQFDNAANDAKYFEIRVPEWFEAGHRGGLIIQAVNEGRADPCDPQSASVALGPGADAVFDHLATIPQLTISELSDATLAGWPARQARVTAEAGTATCLFVWADPTERFISEPDLRVIAADVDGQHVVVTIFGERENPGWPEMADRFLSSMQWGPVASPTP
jgi:hypothetical protein